MSGVTFDEASLKLYIDTHIREMAKSRCRFGSLTPGCLSNREIRDWALRIGLRSRVVGLATKLQIAGDRVTLLTGDPGASGPVIWYAANQAAAVDQSLADAEELAQQAMAKP